MNGLTITEIEKVLDEKVRPKLQYHEGDIQLLKLEQDCLYVRLMGQCMNCPSAELTLEHTVNAALKEAFPELKDTVLVSGVSDELLSDMRSLLKNRHKEVEE